MYVFVCLILHMCIETNPFHVIHCKKLKDLVIRDASWYNNEIKCIIQGKKKKRDLAKLFVISIDL